MREYKDKIYEEIKKYLLKVFDGKARVPHVQSHYHLSAVISPQHVLSIDLKSDVMRLGVACTRLLTNRAQIPAKMMSHNVDLSSVGVDFKVFHVCV